MKFGLGKIRSTAVQWVSPNVGDFERQGQLSNNPSETIVVIGSSPGNSVCVALYLAVFSRLGIGWVDERHVQVLD